MADSSEQEAKRFPWPTILISALATLLVSVLAGMVLFFLQAREPHLVFTAADTIPFSGTNRVIAVYQVSVTNDGKKSVDDVVCYIRIAGASIDQKRVFADPSLSYSDSVTGDAMRIEIPSLNPSESEQVSALASSQASLPSRPEVSVRGRGVMGEEKPRTTSENPFLLGFTISLLAVSAALALRFVLRLVSRHGPASPLVRLIATTLDGDQHSDDQRHVIAYVLRLHGLSTEADRLVSQPHKTSYWAEADRMAQMAVQTDDPQYAEKIRSALLTLVDYAAINPNSTAIVYYDLARVSAALGRAEEARAFLSRATKAMPKLIGKRISIDPLLKSFGPGQ